MRGGGRNGDAFMTYVSEIGEEEEEDKRLKSSRFWCNGRRNLAREGVE